MHVRARSRKSCCTGRIGGLIVGGIMVGSTEGPVSLRAAECGRWLKTPFLVAHTSVFVGSPDARDLCGRNQWDRDAER
jgi:hypothetical protein